MQLFQYEKHHELGTFTDLYQHTVGCNELLSTFLPGHLAIEFLLRKLVVQYDAKLAGLADQLNHARLMQLTYDVGLIDKAQKDVLLCINSIRNKLAHNVIFKPELGELRTLWIAAAGAFSDLTDGISQGSESLTQAKTLDDLDGWEFPELFVQICYDLHGEYVGRGGDEEDF